LAAHTHKEITEVLYGNENIIKRTLETFSWIQRSLEGCIDHTELAMHVTTQPIWDGLKPKVLWIQRSKEMNSFII
jgi:hypothetical protein